MKRNHALREFHIFQDYLLVKGNLFSGLTQLKSGRYLENHSQSILLRQFDKVSWIVGLWANDCPAQELLRIQVHQLKLLAEEQRSPCLILEIFLKVAFFLRYSLLQGCNLLFNALKLLLRIIRVVILQTCADFLSVLLEILLFLLRLSQFFKRFEFQFRPNLKNKVPEIANYRRWFFSFLQLVKYFGRVALEINFIIRVALKYKFN